MIHLPARDISVPTSISPEAQSVLAMGRLGPPSRALPALDDTEGWKAYVAETDGFVRSMVGDATAGFKGSIVERDIGPCPLYVVTPDGVAQSDRRVLLDIHGGAWVLGGGDLCKRTTIASADAMESASGRWTTGCPLTIRSPHRSTTVSRPTGFSWTNATRRDHRGRDVCGGNLAAALILRARDEGLPLPAAVLFNTGAFDLTGSGDSWQTNDGLDNVLSGPVEPCTELYAGGHDRREPYISPLFGDLAGFRPSYFSAARATGSSLTTFACTGLCARPESRPSSMCGRQPVTAGSSAWPPRTPSDSQSCGASPTRT